jgi:hypothetical protein
MSGPNTEPVIRNGSTRLCKQPRLAESPLGRRRWDHGPKLLEIFIGHVERRLGCRRIIMSHNQNKPERPRVESNIKPSDQQTNWSCFKKDYIIIFDSRPTCLSIHPLISP